MYNINSVSSSILHFVTQVLPRDFLSKMTLQLAMSFIFKDLVNIPILKPGKRKLSNLYFTKDLLINKL